MRMQPIPHEDAPMRTHRPQEDTPPESPCIPLMVGPLSASRYEASCVGKPPSRHCHTFLIIMLLQLLLKIEQQYSCHKYRALSCLRSHLFWLHKPGPEPVPTPTTPAPVSGASAPEGRRAAQLKAPCRAIMEKVVGST